MLVQQRQLYALTTETGDMKETMRNNHEEYISLKYS